MEHQTLVCGETEDVYLVVFFRLLGDWKLRAHPAVHVPRSCPAGLVKFRTYMIVYSSKIRAARMRACAHSRQEEVCWAGLVWQVRGTRALVEQR